MNETLCKPFQKETVFKVYILEYFESFNVHSSVSELDQNVVRLGK